MPDNARSIEGFLGRDAVEAITRPAPEQATGLPNVSYTSPEFLALENELLFARTWVAAGFAHQIPEPGDAVPVTAGGVPIILLRDHDGAVRAFQNVCRHRGTQLLTEPCKGASAITCPYHWWSYNLDGTVAHRPHFDGPDKHNDDPGRGLFPVRCGQWFDVIFVNIDGKAPPLETYMKPFAERLAGYDFSTLRHGGTVTWEFQANWKLVQENYIEPYHVFAVHPRLEEWTPTNLHQFGHDGVCCINGVSFESADDGRGGSMPLLPNLTDEQAHRGVYLHLFPSLDCGVWPDHVHTLTLTPLGPDQTHEEINIYFAEEAMAPEHEAAREAVFEGWRELNGEDVDVVERLQKGRSAPAFDGGMLSPYWDTVTHHFARLVVEGMG